MKLKVLSILTIAIMGFFEIAEAADGIHGLSCENNMYRQTKVYLDGTHLFFSDSFSWLPMSELKLQLQNKYRIGEIISITDPGITVNTEQLRCDRSSIENFNCILESSQAFAKLSLTVMALEKKFGKNQISYLKLSTPVKLQKFELSMKEEEGDIKPHANFQAEVQLQMEEEWTPVALQWKSFFYLKSDEQSRLSFCRSW